MNTLLKQRRESADMFHKGNRPELAAKEEAEIKIIEAYLPSAPSARGVRRCGGRRHIRNGRQFSQADGPCDESRPSQTAGKRIDGKALSELVKTKLPAWLLSQFPRRYSGRFRWPLRADSQAWLGPTAFSVRLA